MRAVGQPGYEGVERTPQGGHGDGDIDEKHRNSRGGRRPGVRPADVLGALALAVGVVLDLGSWRSYLAESGPQEEAPMAADAALGV
ncbi:hypothetical protein ACF1DY_06660 [Streptomyces albus]